MSPTRSARRRFGKLAIGIHSSMLALMKNQTMAARPLTVPSAELEAAVDAVVALRR